ncbi:hypothetical protein J3E69DRAFT_331522 [Trichoderma sp. SZMC 28015]
MLCYLLLLYSFVLFAKFCLVGMARAYWDYQTSARLHTHSFSLIASLFSHLQASNGRITFSRFTTAAKPLLLPSVSMFPHLHRGIPPVPLSCLAGLTGLVHF